MSYIKPEDARSPRGRWTLIDVLFDGGSRDGDGEGHALAIGEWDTTRVLAMRWNGDEEGPAGNPQSRGIPTWFIVPARYNAALLATVPESKQALAKALLGLQ